MQRLVLTATPLSKFLRFAPMSAPSPNFVVTKPQKHWAISYADLTGPSFSYDCVVKGPDGLPAWGTNSISDEDALNPNVPPGQLPNGQMALPEIATPINKAAVDAAGLELCTDMMGNAALAPPLTPETTLLQWTGADEAIMTRLSAYLTKQGF